MKLNLLPAQASKAASNNTAIVIAAALAIIGIVLAVILAGIASNTRQAAVDRAAAARPRADQAVRVASEADTIIVAATGLTRNLTLAEDMIEHNYTYPRLYDQVISHVPSFFRVTSIAAAPAGENVSVVTMNGILLSYQQYADLMLALLRIPGAMNVTRSGFNFTAPYVPALNESDQVGTPIRPGEQNFPSDPQMRLAALMARAAAEPSGFQNVSNFGTESESYGPMPDWSAISVTVTVAEDIRPPDPQATIMQAGPAPAAPAGGGFTPPTGGGAGPMPGAGLQNQDEDGF